MRAVNTCPRVLDPASSGTSRTMTKKGGASWETLVVNWPETTYEVETGVLTGATTGPMRVLASDGFDVGVGVSEGYFSVPKHTPGPDIAWPMDASVFAGGQRVSLGGAGSDREVIGNL